MPTYEYIREDGEVIEVIQKFSDEPLKVCPNTGLAVKRKISGGSGVIYKGSGWYITDYKNGSESKSPQPQKTESTSSASTSKESATKTKTNTAKTAD